MPTEDARPIVFISYSHDSDAHFTLVRGLSASLARDGCDCRLDANKETEDTGEDWPTWMTRQLREADFVFCVITQTYQRRFDGEEKPEAGRGVAWEAGLIRRILYNDKLKNHRIFPVLFKQADQQHIPLLLQYDHFVLDGASGYEKLIRKITNQPVHQPPTSGSAPVLPAKPTEPLFARPVSDLPDESPSCTTVEVDGDSPDLADEESRKARQARQFSKMVEALDKKKDAVGALTESLRTYRRDAGPLDDIKSLINLFNILSDDDATNCINRAFKKLCQRNNTSGAVDIGGFVEAWLPVVYEHHDRIPGIRSELADPDKATVTVPTKLPVATEITMAEAEEGLARLELSARNALVSRYDLGGFGEPGLDEDGKEQQRQLDELLSRRFLKATDKSDFERTVHGLVGAIGRYHDSQGELGAEDSPETRRRKLKGILGDLYETLDRRFFFCLEVDDFNLDVFKALNKDYPTLAFLISSCADEVGEADRYRKLSRIIATAKGDTTLCEEIAKNA